MGNVVSKVTYAFTNVELLRLIYDTLIIPVAARIGAPFFHMNDISDIYYVLLALFQIYLIL